MILSAIVAVSRNGVIGKDNTLPWRLPADLQYFKKTTSGHHIILGRKNYEDIRRPLPNRVNLVLSRQAGYEAPGCIVLPSLESAIDYARSAGETECFICGGAEIYRQALPMVQRLYLTRIDADFEGDIAMPDMGSGWNEEWCEIHEPDEKNLWPYRFLRYSR